jgi:hypothetical protein
MEKWFTTSREFSEMGLPFRDLSISQPLSQPGIFLLNQKKKK